MIAGAERDVGFRSNEAGVTAEVVNAEKRLPAFDLGTDECAGREYIQSKWDAIEH